MSEVGKSPQVRVFIVDDHEVVRVGIAGALAAEPDLHLVGEAATVAEAAAAIAQLAPDVAVLDERIHDESGVALARHLGRTSPATRCILYTGFEAPITAAAAQEAGAYGCLFKSAPLGELFDAIRIVAGGETLWKTDRRHPSTPASADRLATLTAGERRVLALLAEAKTNGEIAEDLGLAEQTVKNLVSSMMAKAGFTSRSDAAVYMVRVQEPASLPLSPSRRRAKARTGSGDGAGAGGRGEA